MTSIITTTLFFFTPSAVANSTAVIAGKLPVLKKFSYPLDFYKTFKNKRILGDHKTIRGIITGCLTGTLTTIILKQAFLNNPTLQETITLPYSTFDPIILGLLLSLGALAGDAVKSFFKSGE